MQKKNMISIFVCMLLITVTVLPVTGTINDNTDSKKETDDYENLMKYVIENGIISNNDWLEQDKLIASDGAADDWFGCSVSIDGEYAIIGAYRDDDNGDDSGSAYIFKRDGAAWNEQAKLLASDGVADDCFGRSVSIDGDYAIIGAIYDDDNGARSGSAYIFKRDGTTWTEQAKLLASDGAEYDRFGFSVSIDGEYAIIGALGDDDNGEDSGSAYVFKKASGGNQPPTVETLPAYGITDFGVTLSGQIIDDGGEACLIKFYYVDPDGNMVSPSDWHGAYTSGEIFYERVDGLIPNTIYKFKASAINTAGEDEGEYQYFTTDKEHCCDEYDYSDERLSHQAFFPEEDFGYAEVSGKWMRCGIHINYGLGFHVANTHLGCEFQPRKTGKARITFSGDYSGNWDKSFGALITYRVTFRVTKENGGFLPFGVNRYIDKNSGYFSINFEEFGEEFEEYVTLNFDKNKNYLIFAELWIKTFNAVIPLPEWLGGPLGATYTDIDLLLNLYGLRIEYL